MKNPNQFTKPIHTKIRPVFFFTLVCCVSAGVSSARDTTLVTQIVFKDTSNTVLRLVSQSWSSQENGLLRQRQFEGDSVNAPLLSEQIYDSRGHTLRLDVFDSLGRVVRRNDYSYDGEGHLIGLVLQDISSPAAFRFQRITYTLRSDGQNSEAIAKDSIGQTLSILVYRYGSDNRLIETEERRRDSIFELSQHRWASDGSRDTVLRLEHGRDSVEIRNREFNSGGKVTVEHVQLRRPDSSWFSRETRSSYDSLNRLVSEDNFDGENRPISHIEYVFSPISFTAVSVTKGLTRLTRRDLKHGILVKNIGTHTILGRMKR
jgi:hypothetical protein